MAKCRDAVDLRQVSSFHFLAAAAWWRCYTICIHAHTLVSPQRIVTCQMSTATDIRLENCVYPLPISQVSIA